MCLGLERHYSEQIDDKQPSSTCTARVPLLGTNPLNSLKTGTNTLADLFRAEQIREAEQIRCYTVTQCQAHTQGGLLRVTCNPLLKLMIFIEHVLTEENGKP